jgi:hypothetical protein
MTSSACRPGWRYSPPPFSKCFCCVSCISGFTISLRSVCGLHRALRATRRALRATRLALTANRLHPASFSIPACGAPGEQRSLSARMRAPVSTHACAHATRVPAEPNRARTPAEPPDPTTLQFRPRHRKVLLGLKTTDLRACHGSRTLATDIGWGSATAGSQERTEQQEHNAAQIGLCAPPLHRHALSQRACSRTGQRLRPPAHAQYPNARRETSLSAPRRRRSGAHAPGFSLTCPRRCGCCYGLWQ